MSEPSPPTSIDKALEVCEALSGHERGLSLKEIARGVKLPPSTVHRLLGVLKRRGYVRQDEENQRYSLTLKMLDLSFRLLGRSDVRLHAYPLMREYVLRSKRRGFIAIPAAGEVTYLWSVGPDEVAMRTVYGKDMPGHCSIYLTSEQTSRRLSCVRLVRESDVARSSQIVARFGVPSEAGSPRLSCTCAPVQDYTGREVGRVGVFAHGVDDTAILNEHNRGVWELGRHISVRLGFLPSPERFGASA